MGVFLGSRVEGIGPGGSRTMTGRTLQDENQTFINLSGGGALIGDLS
jgi:hypothetical protein